MAQSSNSGYEDLRVWQSSIELAQSIYLLTKQFPKDQLYSLTGQIQRSVVSVDSNIAEGSARNSHQEFIYFLGSASGSLAEVVTQLTIAHKIGFRDDNNFHTLLKACKSVGKMLSALKSSIRVMKSASNQ